MRVAPVGAYFADDLDEAAAQAAASAAVTHAHPEGQAGATAVAVAAAMAWRTRGTDSVAAGRMLLETARDHTPPGPTRDGLQAAFELPADTPTAKAAVLGNGSRVISSDTVPLALFCAARHLGEYQAALWDTVSGLGDRDTTCAIAGGVVAMFVGRDGIPATWLAAREPLDLGA
jgi:ADP-ribosylglycohydrolase